MLDLEDVELALFLLQRGFDLLNLCALQEFVSHLLHLGPQVTNPPLQLVPLDRELRYLNLLCLVLLFQALERVGDALFVMWVPGSAMVYFGATPGSEAL